MSSNPYMINMQKMLYVAEILHTRGYENLHVIPSLSPSGLSWRCVFMTMDSEPVIVSNWIYQKCDINVALEIDVLELTNNFEREHYIFLKSCVGENKEYAEWYHRMLNSLEEEELPYAVSDYFSPCEYWQTSTGRRILTLPDEKRFLDIFLNVKNSEGRNEVKTDDRENSVPEAMPVNTFDYTSAINALNHANVWVEKLLVISIKPEQYIAMLKGYQLHNDMRYGLLYDQKNDYFYAYRSGSVVGKYKVELDEDRYYISECYANPDKIDFMVIYDCVMEACRQNGVGYDREYFAGYIQESYRENGIDD